MTSQNYTLESVLGPEVSNSLLELCYGHITNILNNYKLVGKHGVFRRKEPLSPHSVNILSKNGFEDFLESYYYINNILVCEQDHKKVENIHYTSLYLVYDWYGRNFIDYLLSMVNSSKKTKAEKEILSDINNELRESNPIETRWNINVIEITLNLETEYITSILKGIHDDSDSEDDGDRYKLVVNMEINIEDLQSILPGDEEYERVKAKFANKV